MTGGLADAPHGSEAVRAGTGPDAATQASDVAFVGAMESALAEADRVMTVCNVCRYCEGLCAVFPAMQKRPSFSPGDLIYLANLCHNCGACHADCQFAPPHIFAVDVPRSLAAVRTLSYAAYAWPGIARPVFARNGLAIAAASLAAIAGFAISFGVVGAEARPGQFYNLMPHWAMALLPGAALCYSAAAIVLSLRQFSRGIAQPPVWRAGWRPLRRAVTDAVSLQYLHGGGGGCGAAEDGAADHRRLCHHFLFYGFLLCLASTLAGTLYHYGLGRAAPYAWYEPPVVLGVLGGVGLIAGALGFLATWWRRAPAPEDAHRRGFDTGFTTLLLAAGVSGLALLLLRGTNAMGMLLAGHLGVVCVLFYALPYSKFLHAPFRFLALWRYAQECSGPARPPAPDGADS